jgi:hypothetical protein
VKIALLAADEVLGAWVIKYAEDQKQELKPWIRCDGRGKHPYIEVSYA